jgi:DNA repair protein RadC
MPPTQGRRSAGTSPVGDFNSRLVTCPATKRLIQASDLMGIKILGHIITGDGRYISFADSRFL